MKDKEDLCFCGAKATGFGIDKHGDYVRACSECILYCRIAGNKPTSSPVLTCKEAAKLFESHAYISSSDSQYDQYMAKALLMEAFGDIPVPDSVKNEYPQIFKDKK